MYAYIGSSVSLGKLIFGSLGLRLELQYLLVLRMIGQIGNVRTGAILRQLDNNTYGRVYVGRPEESDTATNGQRRVSATSSPAAYVVDGGSVYVDAREQAMVGEHHMRRWISAAAMGERVPAMDWNGARPYAGGSAVYIDPDDKDCLVESYDSDVHVV
jgi:hypothetical protein